MKEIKHMRMVGVLLSPEEKQPEVGGITAIIDYGFYPAVENLREIMRVTELSVYCAYPTIVKNHIPMASLLEQIREEIWNLEGMINVDFAVTTVTIL